MKHVTAVLWRNFNKTTFDTLKGKSSGQYDIRLGSTLDLDKFFTGEKHENKTALGGYDINIKVQEYGIPGNPDYTSKSPLTIRYMGGSSSRKDWNIPSQRPTTAYPLWIESGRMPTSKDDNSFLLLIRTTDGLYYGRILLQSEVANVPSVLQKEIVKKEVGMFCLDSVRTSTEAEQVYDELMENTNLLMYGPPGTGKTTLMQEVVSIFDHGGPGEILFDETKKIDYFSLESISSNSKVEWTTFHQSYSYEEFILGLTTDTSSSKLLDLKPKQGTLIELCEFARIKGNRALLVIDELNRANVSKVFGEFITVIEPDKRLAEDGTSTPKTVQIKLPYLADGDSLSFTNGSGTYTLNNPFTMPLHVYTLASMNSIDKSIFPLDSALRRRFHRHDVYFNKASLERHFRIEGMVYTPVMPQPSDISGYLSEMVLVLITCFMDVINSKIKLFMGKDYTLGSSYVWNLVERESTQEIVDGFRASLIEQIYPQMEEIFRNREEQLMYIMGCDTTSISPCEIIEPTDDEIEIGANESIVFNIDKLNDLQLIQWMENIIK